MSKKISKIISVQELSSSDFFKMHEFDYRVKLLKFCGIERYPSNLMNIFSKILMIWYTFTIVYSASSSVTFACYSKNILDIFEVMTSLPGSIIMTKHIIFYWRKEKFFAVIDEIRSLNEKCEFRSFEFKILVFFLSQVWFFCRYI